MPKLELEPSPATTGTPAAGLMQFTLTRAILRQTSRAGARAAVPFSLGYAFKMGDVPAGSSVVSSTGSLQVTPRNHWPDGSLKFAQLAGLARIPVSEPLVVALSASSNVPSSTPLTLTDLKNTRLTARTSCGSFGTADWATSAWDSPFQTWVSGPLMSSWIYRRPVGTDAHLVAWLEVRLFANGAVEVLPWIENGYMRVAGPKNKSAVYSFALNGNVRFSNAIDLPHHCRTPLVSGSILSHWLGTDPEVTPRHDVAYLRETRLVPNITTTVGSVVGFALPASYTPLQLGNYPVGMPGTGYAPSIGLLPQWDALYLASTDPSVLGAIERNAYSAGRYELHYRDEATNRPLRFSQHPNFSDNSSATYDYPPAPTGTAPGGWDIPHHPSVGYMAYLLTGRMYHLETLQFAATWNYQHQPSSVGVRNGAAGLFKSGSGASTVRGAAWAVRTLLQAATATPDGDVLHTEFVDSLEANIGFNHATYVAQPNNPFGFVQGYATGYGPGNDGIFVDAPWQQDFYTAAFGYALAANPPVSAAAKAKLAAFFNWKAQSAVGRLGRLSTTDYLYRDATPYNMVVAPSDAPDFAGGTGPWYPNWRAVYNATNSFAAFGPYVDDGTLRGGNFPEMTSYWANFLPAIAYAVEHDVPGALAGYLRMTEASNYGALIANAPRAPEWAVTPIVGLRPAIGRLPDWVSALPLMQWYDIPGTALSGVVPAQVPLGYSPSAKIYAWNGACIKRSGSVYMLGAAGGHNDYGGNEVDALKLNVATPAWSQLRAPTINSQIINGQGDGNGLPTQIYLDGRPSSTHTYHSTQFIESRDRMVVFSSPGYSGSSGALTPAGWGHKTDQINHAFNVASGDWDIPSSIADFPVSGDFTSQLCVKHPYTDDVIVSKNYGNGLYKWTCATNTWALLTPNTRSIWYCGAAVDPTRNRMLIAGGYASGSPAEVRSFGSGERQAVVFTGVWASDSNLSAYAAVEYDEALDCYWTLDMFTPDGGVTYQPRAFKVDASTWNVTQPATTGAGPVARQNGFHNALRYVPELRGLVIADSYTGNVKFMRTAE